MYNASYNTRGYRGNHRRRSESKIDRFARIRESSSSFPAFSFSTKPPRRYRRPTFSRPPAVARVCVSRPSCARASTVDTSSAPRRIVPKCGTTRAASTPATKTDFCVPLRSEVFARAATTTTTTTTTTTRGSAPGRAKARATTSRARLSLVAAFDRARARRARVGQRASVSAASTREGVRGDRARDRKKQFSIVDPFPPEMLTRRRPRAFVTEKNQSTENVSINHTDRPKYIILRSSLRI